MAESKSAALPLGYAPTGGSLPPWRADHSGEAWTDQRPLAGPPACSVEGSAAELSPPRAAASAHAGQVAKPGTQGFRLSLFHAINRTVSRRVGTVPAATHCSI